MPSPLPYIPFPAARGGVRNDQSQNEIGPEFLWAAENFVLHDGVVRTRHGLQEVGSIQDQRIQGIYEHQTAEGELSVVYATLEGMFAYVGDGNPDVDLDVTLSGGKADQAVFRTFIKSDINYLLMTNGKDTLQKWDGDTSNAAEDATGTPPVMRGMMVLNNRLIALGLVGDHPNAVDCSDPYDFEAGWGNNRVLLADSPGAIIGGLEMGNLQGAIYMENGIYMAQAVGNPAPFTYRLVWPLPGAGPVSSNAMCKLPSGEHAFVGQDGNVYIFDGVAARPVGRHIQKFILGSADLNLGGLIACAFDPDQRDLWIVYPEAGQVENNCALAIKLPEGSLWPQRSRSLTTFIGASLTAVAKARVPAVLTLGDILAPIGDVDTELGDMETRRSELLFGTLSGAEIDMVHRYAGSTWTNGGVMTSFTAANVNDGDYTNRAFTIAHGNTGTLKFDFGASGSAPAFMGIRLWATAAALHNISVDAFFSDDNAAYTAVGTLSDFLPPPGDLAFEANWADPNSHRYWKFEITVGGGPSADFWEVELLEEATPAAIEALAAETDSDAFVETALLPSTPGLIFGSGAQIEHFVEAADGKEFTVKLGSSDYGFERELGDADTVTVESANPTLSEHDLSGRYFCMRMDVPGTPEAASPLTWKGSAMHFAPRGSG